MHLPASTDRYSSSRVLRSRPINRNHLISTIDFSSGEQDFEMLDRAIAIAATLTKLREIKISRWEVQSLCGSMNHLGAPKYERDNVNFKLFRSLAPKIQKLVLPETTVASSLLLLALFSAVNDLESIGIPSDSRLLEVLDDLYSPPIYWNDWVYNCLPWVFQELGWTFNGQLLIYSLRSFTFFGNELDENFFNFVAKFPALEHLNISPKDQLLVSTTYSLPQPLLNLRHLEFDSQFAVSTSTLKLFLASPIQTLEISSFVNKWANKDFNALSTYIRQSTHLRRLNISKTYLSFNEYTTLTDLWKQKNTQCRFTRIRSDTWISESSLDPNLDQLIYYLPILEESFRLGLLKIWEFIDQEDLAGMKEMFDGCEWLRERSR